jgi:hypothetical protein
MPDDISRHLSARWIAIAAGVLIGGLAAANPVLPWFAVGLLIADLGRAFVKAGRGSSR